MQAKNGVTTRILSVAPWRPAPRTESPSSPTITARNDNEPATGPHRFEV
jgi:hypothetical protein